MCKVKCDFECASANILVLVEGSIPLLAARVSYMISCCFLAPVMRRLGGTWRPTNLLRTSPQTYSWRGLTVTSSLE